MSKLKVGAGIYLAIGVVVAGAASDGHPLAMVVGWPVVAGAVITDEYSRRWGKVRRFNEQRR